MTREERVAMRGADEPGRPTPSRWPFAGSQLARQASRFALTTGLSACLSFGLPVALVEFGGVGEQRAVQIGFLAAYLVNVAVMRSFVFRSTNHWARDLLFYMLTNGLFRLAEYAAFYGLTEGFGVPYAAALFGVLCASTIVKFFAYRFVFR